VLERVVAGVLSQRAAAEMLGLTARQVRRLRAASSLLRGRRNFLFTGSVRGGERLAVAYTLVDNCILLGLDVSR
jgi:hypothetical protein